MDYYTKSLLKTESVIRAYQIMQTENWKSINQSTDEEDVGNKFTINPERVEALKYNGIDPEEVAIAKDTVRKAKLTDRERDLISLLLMGYSAIEMGFILKLSVQRIYLVFKSATEKVLNQRNKSLKYS